MEKKNNKSKEIKEENYKFTPLLIKRHFLIKSFKYIINL